MEKYNDPRLKIKYLWEILKEYHVAGNSHLPGAKLLEEQIKELRRAQHLTNDQKKV